MSTPYRIAPKQRAIEPTFTCSLGAPELHWFVALSVRLVLVGAATLFVYLFGARVAAAATCAIGLAWVLAGLRRRKGTTVVFHVAAGRVRIERAGFDPIDVALDALLDVRLDTKAVSAAPVPRTDVVHAVYRAGSPTQVPVDHAHVEVEIAGREPFYLVDEFVRASVAADAFRAIRTFLRGHGWTPKDERVRVRVAEEPAGAGEGEEEGEEEGDETEAR